MKAMAEKKKRKTAQGNAAEQRLQKIIAQAGVASRRAAEKMITDGRVRVNGKIVRVLGSKADPIRDSIEIDGDLHGVSPRE